MNRRGALKALLVLFVPSSLMARMSLLSRRSSVSTLVGTGSKGFSDQQINDPYGLVIGPDGALYFCDLGNQRVRRFDFGTRRMQTVAGSGEEGYLGDGSAATKASLGAPHEIQFDLRWHRDPGVFRRRRAGIAVAVALSAQHCRAPNAPFLAHLRHRQPPHSPRGVLDGAH